MRTRYYVRTRLVIKLRIISFFSYSSTIFFLLHHSTTPPHCEATDYHAPAPGEERALRLRRGLPAGDAEDSGVTVPAAPVPKLVSICRTQIGHKSTDVRQESTKQATRKSSQEHARQTNLSPPA